MPQITCNNIDMLTADNGEAAFGVWWVRISENLHLLDKAQSTLSADEHERADSYHDERDRQRFLLSRLVLRMLLAERIGIAAGDVLFDQGKQKKPFIKNAPGRAVHYNVAHSEDIVAITISDSPTGIDVEYVKQDFSFRELLPTCFSADEQQVINQSADPAQSFYQLWTRKEALLKATGKGIDNDLVLVPCTDGVHKALVTVIRSREDWVVSTFPINSQYVCSVAYEPGARPSFQGSIFL